VVRVPAAEQDPTAAHLVAGVSALGGKFDGFYRRAAEGGDLWQPCSSMRWESLSWRNLRFAAWTYSGVRPGPWDCFPGAISGRDTAIVR